MIKIKLIKYKDICIYYLINLLLIKMINLKYL